MTLKERLANLTLRLACDFGGDSRVAADALARIEELEACVQTDNAAWAREHERAEQAEATLERVRGLRRYENYLTIVVYADDLDVALNPGDETP